MAESEHGSDWDGDRGLPGATVTSLLHVGMVGARSLVERVLERLSGPEGRGWFEEAIHSMGGDVAALGAGERLSIETLRRLKDDAKVAVGDADDEPAALRGTLMYLVSVAGGLALHGEMISSQGRGQLEEPLLDLGEYAPAPWGAMFVAAADQLAASG